MTTIRPRSRVWTPLSVMTTLAVLITSSGSLLVQSCGPAWGNPQLNQEMTVNPPSPDPLGSPFPLPWAWVEHQQLNVRQRQTFTLKTAALISPDGLYQALAEFTLVAHPNFSHNQLTSQLIITNLQTGAVQQWMSQSLMSPDALAEFPQGQGLISVLLPVGWSKNGEQLLVRQFQGIFSSDMATDIGVIWSRHTQALTTIWPRNADYDQAVLLGWSTQNATQVLFETTTFGRQSQAELWAVDSQQDMLATPGDQPQVYGQSLHPGSQAQSPAMQVRPVINSQPFVP